ncbi:MAG TPA: hypothetical protein VHO47_03745 [Candidatus Babeliales bacterium]|nr:hypothetical protein [Candidatus Babeliales bacterium]
MKLNRLLLFLSLIVAFCDHQLQAARIGLPLDSFLIEAATSKAAAKVLSGGSWWAAATKNLPDEFFKALEKIETQEDIEFKAHQPQAFWKRKLAPAAIYRSILGVITLDTLLRDVNERLDKNNVADRETIKVLASMAFNAKDNDEVMKVCPEAINFIDQLQRNGHDVFIVDNFNGELAQKARLKIQKKLIEKNRNSKQLEIIVSGDLHAIIGQKEFHENVMKKANPNIVVVSDPHYADAWKSYSVQAQKPAPSLIICAHVDHASRNVDQIRKELKEKYNIKI